jgi:hypothetical protein
MYLFICSAGDQTQGLEHTRQILNTELYTQFQQIILNASAFWLSPCHMRSAVAFSTWGIMLVLKKF